MCIGHRAKNNTPYIEECREYIAIKIPYKVEKVGLFLGPLLDVMNDRAITSLAAAIAYQYHFCALHLVGL